MVCGRARVELKKKMRPEVEIKVGTWKGKGFYAQPSVERTTIEQTLSGKKCQLKFLQLLFLIVIFTNYDF